MKNLFFILIAIVAIIPAYAANDEQSEDNFISNSISIAADRLNKYASGEEEIVSENAKGAEKELNQDRDVFGGAN